MRSPRKGSGKATLEGVSRYLRLLGVELPIGLIAGSPGVNQGERSVSFITRLDDEEGLFICVDPYAAQLWFDKWRRSNPHATDAETQGARRAAYFLNTVDVDTRPVGRTFFKLDDEGNLIERAVPGHGELHREAGTGSRTWWPGPTRALAAATIVLALTTAGLLAAVLIDSSDHGTRRIEPGASAGAAKTSSTWHDSEAQAGSTTQEGKTQSRSDSSRAHNPTARTPGALGARATIERYWRKREQQQLSSAYADLSPKLQADPGVGSESSWVANQKQDALQSMIVRVRPRNVGRRTAQVDVVRLRTETLRLGCREWSGLYNLIRHGGRWLIDSSSLVPRPC